MPVSLNSFSIDSNYIITCCAALLVSPVMLHFGRRDKDLMCIFKRQKSRPVHIFLLIYVPEERSQVKQTAFFNNTSIHYLCERMAIYQTYCKCLIMGMPAKISINPILCQ